MTGPRAPLHLGGPLGLAGLAMLAVATGLFVMAGINTPAPARTERALSLTESPPSGESPQAQTGDAVSIVQPAELPGELPASAETTSEAPVQLAQANPGSTEVIFIVRIKGEPEIDVITRNFRRDPAAAQIAWANLQRRYPALRDFRLAGASYSGEIRLGYRLPPGLEPTRATINDIQSRIMQVQSVSYADPDFIAQPGKE